MSALPRAIEALGALDPRGEQHDRERPARRQRRVVGDVEAGDELAQRVGVLLGEHLGRHHERALAAAVHRREQGGERHGRLAGPDVALEESVHRELVREVREQLGDRAALRAGRLVGERGEEPRDERRVLAEQLPAADERVGRVRMVRDAAGVLRERRLARDERELQPHELVEDEPGPRRRHVGHGVGGVDPAHRRGPALEPEAGGERLKGVGELPRALERLGARPRELPAREPRLRRRGVDRDHAHRPSRGPRVTVHPDEDVDDRVHHPAAPPVEVEGAEEQRLDARRQLLRAPRLVEEGDGHPARLVLDVHLHQRAPVARAPGPDRHDLGQHDGLVADGEVGEVRLLGPVVVPPREREQQVEHRADPGRPQRLGTPGPDRAQPVDIDLVELREPATVRHSTPKRYG